MGNETSFQSFPAHLHNLLSVTLDDLGWYIHLKVYPKFKIRYNISVATEVFSKWLVQFENLGTGVVSLSRCVGGIPGAEVVLLRNERRGFRHRILGVDYFNSPLLGMHPGVTSAGLGNLFRSEGKSPSEEDSSAAGGGCMPATIRVRLRCQRFLPAARWGSSSTEDSGRISRLCRVSRVWADNNIPAGGGGGSANVRTQGNVGFGTQIYQ